MIPNKSAGTLTLIDNGIGMTKTDLINLCTISESKSKVCVRALNKGAYIYGFYSAFLVADKVTVTSKHNDDAQYVLELSAGSPITIRVDNGDQLGRGTKIVLHIKQDQTKYLEESKIKPLWFSYSTMVPYSMHFGTNAYLNENRPMPSSSSKWMNTKLCGYPVPKVLFVLVFFAVALFFILKFLCNSSLELSVLISLLVLLLVPSCLYLADKICSVSSYLKIISIFCKKLSVKIE